MSNAELFCEIAYEALKKEEDELRQLAKENPDDALSVGGIGEAPVVYLIKKEALRRKIRFAT